MTVPMNVEIIEDDEVTFLCFVTEGTPPVSFKWYRDQNQSPLSTDTVRTNYSMYTLQPVQSIHSGWYHCGALNEAGKEEVSNRILVTGQTMQEPQDLISV